MTKQKSTPDRAALVAIDITKHRHEVLIEVPGMGKCRRQTVLNNRTEHDRLTAALGGLDRPVVIGFEATGNYHQALAYRLLQAGFELRLVSSVALTRVASAAGPSYGLP